MLFTVQVFWLWPELKQLTKHLDWWGSSLHSLSKHLPASTVPMNCQTFGPSKVQAHPWWVMGMAGKHSDHYFWKKWKKTKKCLELPILNSICNHLSTSINHFTNMFTVPKNLSLPTSIFWDFQKKERVYLPYLPSPSMLTGQYAVTGPWVFALCAIFLFFLFKIMFASCSLLRSQFR
jgi:hypothetical protein